MTAVQEFVATQFPNHEIDLLDPASVADLELSDHTVVSQVAGARDGLDLFNLFRRSAPYARVAALAVRPSHSSIVPTDDEDENGVVDLPVRRVILAVLCGALAIGLALAIVMLLTHESAATAAIVGGFGVMIGAAIGAITGGSRLASQRATVQPRAPGRTITVVAAFLEDDASASSFAHSVGPMTNYDVRIVDHSGGWRSPGPVQQ